MAKKNNNSLASAVKSVGPTLSKSEAEQIAKDTGKSVAQVVAKAVEKNVAVGAAAVNQVSKAISGPATGATTGLPASTLQILAPLQNLQMDSGTVYAGSSQYTTPATQTRTVNGGVSSTPASTTYNPIVLPKTTVTVTKAPTAPATTPAPVDPNVSSQTQQWSDSVDDGSQAMVDAINATLAQNQANQELYMGMIGDLMNQMSAANTQQPQSIAPYAMTTTTNAPAQGAQMTQAITRRLKNLNTSLAIAPVETATAGTGLNIPV